MRFDGQPAVPEYGQQGDGRRLRYAERGRGPDDRRFGTGAVEQVEDPDQGRVGELQDDRPSRVGAELHGLRIAPQPAEPGQQGKSAHGHTVSPYGG